jgi:RadC-like JAB domain
MCPDARRTSLHGQVILHINIEDVLLTREIVEAGKLLDVEVLDHLVIGHGKYISMREKGLAFSK